MGTALRIGVAILLNDNWIDLLASSVGNLSDFKDFQDISFAAVALNSTMKIAKAGYNAMQSGVKSGVLNAAFNIFRDFYNPLMFDGDISYNVPIHISEAALNVGIGVFTAELVSTVTALTGKPLFGIATGAAVLALVSFSGI